MGCWTGYVPLWIMYVCLPSLNLPLPPFLFFLFHFFGMFSVGRGGGGGHSLLVCFLPHSIIFWGCRPLTSKINQNHIQIKVIQENISNSYNEYHR